MAIEIIQRGEDPDRIRYKTECGPCGTQFSFLKSDAQWIPDPREGDFLKLRCPECGRDVHIAVSILPSKVYRSASGFGSGG